MMRKTIIVSAEALSSAADMILDHIDEAPHAGMQDALKALSNALSLAAIGTQREGALRVRIEMMESC